MEDYSIEFVERTKILLEKIEPLAKDEGLEVTFFMNTLLGLIVLCSEEGGNSAFQEKIDDSFIKHLIPENIKLLATPQLELNEAFDTPKNFSLSKRAFLVQQDKSWFINKIRNSIAHQNIQPMPGKDKKWDAVKIWNKRGGKTGTKDFEVILSIQHFKEIALYIATEYLKHKKRKGGKA